MKNQVLAWLLLAGVAPAAPQLAAVEEAKLVSSSGAAGEEFGDAVAIDGDTLLVGIKNQLGPGKVFVYVRSGTTWSEQAVLEPNDPGNIKDSFGWAVDLDGDRAVIGRPMDGAVYVFQRTGTNWTEAQRLTNNNPALDLFGITLAVDGDTIAIGAPDWGQLNKGSVFIFTESGGTWTKVLRLVADDTTQGDILGLSVDLEGNTLLVNAGLHDHLGGTASSTTYAFVGSGSSWVQQAEMIDPEPGFTNVDVSLSGDRALIGSLATDLPGVPYPGAAYVYSRTGTVWALESMLTASDPISGDSFGWKVALDGDVAVIGASGKDLAQPGNSACDSGAAYLFTRNGTTWTERQRFTSSDAECGDWFGGPVALDDNTLVTGATRDQPFGPFSGSAYVFAINAGSPVVYCTTGTSASGCTAMLAASGTSSATATTGFSIAASGVEGAKKGLFFFGANGRQANPWGNGTSSQCVAPPVSRAGLQAGTGTPGLCDGSFSEDLNALWCPTCPKSQKNPGPGAIVQAQLWYRDPANTSNQTTSLSDAIEFTVTP